MTTPTPTSLPRPTVADWIARGAFFLLMALVMVSPPRFPTNELDASWRMALGKFFLDGRQFGVDVVFTYGPLGFLMGMTYSGLQFASLLVWQVFQALIFTLVIFRQGQRVPGYARYGFFAYFLLLGLTYEDALHQQVIALAGFELLRRESEGKRLLPALSGALFALLGLIKFTNLMLAMLFVACAAALLLWHRRSRAALWLVAWFAGSFLLGWVLCRQNPLHLPAYFLNSWEISQGYQETMGIPTPPDALRVGLLTLALIVAYAAIYLWTQPDRARGAVTTLALGAYVYLEWKHGFIRADGHMIGYFYALLVPATAFPALLEDGPRFRPLQRGLLLALAGCALLGVSTALPGVLRGSLGNFQERLFGNLDHLRQGRNFVTKYQELLAAECSLHDMPETRAVVGTASIDLLGYEQAILLYNRFNYRPRPVFQSYSVYRPHLARINANYFASARAPDYVLLRLDTIDRRLVTFDDPEVLNLLVHRYEYVLSEKGYQLWHRKPGPFQAAAFAPRPFRTAALAPGQPFLTEEYADRPLWAQVELRPSLLGTLRAFVYKHPIVLLRLQDTQGRVSEYRMPLPQGRAGFIVNPLVEDGVSYMRFAGGKPERLLRSLTVVVAPGDSPYFADEYTVTLSTLTPSTAGREFFRQEQKRLFHMFNLVPVSFDAYNPISEGEIDGKPVMVFHAPSEMILDVPPDAGEFSGSYGFLPGTYTKGGNTDGAVFSVVLLRDNGETTLLERTLDPVHRPADRGLQDFHVTLPPGAGGRLRLRTQPGPSNNFSWDWTAWTGLTLR